MDGKIVEDLVNSYAKKKNLENMNQIKIPYAIATVPVCTCELRTKPCRFSSVPNQNSCKLMSFQIKAKQTKNQPSKQIPNTTLLGILLYLVLG